MNYEAWRMTYQDSEQAARAAFKMVCELSSEVKEIKSDKLAQDAAYNAMMAQRDALRSFAREVVIESSPAVFDVYGGDINESAIKYGILLRVEYNEPCGEECECAMIQDKPYICGRFPDFMTADENADAA